LHRHLRPILSLRRQLAREQLAREQLACGLSSERANERSKRFIATISRRTRSSHVALADCAALEIGS
jgi:transposase